MDKLYIEINIVLEYDNNGKSAGLVFTTMQSFIALYVFKFLGDPINVEIQFVNTKTPVGEKVQLDPDCIKDLQIHHNIDINNDGENVKLNFIKDLQLPIYVQDEVYIAGICAVCRSLISSQKSAKIRQLLGFKGSSLLAPSETSTWTKFCEINIIQTVNNVLRAILRKIPLEQVPVDVVRYENHLKEPVRMHNIYKFLRQKIKEENQNDFKDLEETYISGSNTIQSLQSQMQFLVKHTYAEGVMFTIADLILYPSISIIFHYLGQSLENFTLTKSWMNEVYKFDPKCKEIFNSLCVLPEGDPKDLYDKLPIPECEFSNSLYKRYAKHGSSYNRSFTDQNTINGILNKLQNLQIAFTSENCTTYGGTNINWQQFGSTNLPEKRVERKRHQLENLANAVSSLAGPGDRIIDFCSGSGHLGILLAVKLPKCTIILIDNKAVSMNAARRRAAILKLENVKFYQSNIDYFQGSFSIGTSLHACGTATDIVMQKCLQYNAKFVCCPCCYGTLQSMPHVKYPLSQKFQNLIAEREFMCIAHSADQENTNERFDAIPNASIMQGQLCMDVIDTDRKCLAEENNYQVILTRLQPENCTPKNRLLVGVPVALR